MEKLVYGGDGLARLDGRVVLAPYVLPGEWIRARAERERPGLLHARTLEVLEPAAGRIAAQCPYYGRCGGCHYQHAGYEYQLTAKRAILEEALQRLGKIQPPAEIGILSADPWGYRNRAQLHIEGARIGYREARSHRLCAVDQCPISSPRLNEAIRTLAEMLHDGRWPRFIRSLEIFTDEQSVQLNVLETDRPVARRFFEWCFERIPGLVEGALDYQGRFQVSRGAFFQVNRFLPDRLVEASLGEAHGETALDLYAGVGLFSLPLARRFASVNAVESGSAATRDLVFNAERAGLTGLRAHHATAEAYLEALDQAPDLVLADPPRAGLGKTAVKRLLELHPKSLVIVSCDPATLARDLAALLGGGYRLERLTMADLFPQTYHLETIAQLSAA